MWYDPKEILTHMHIRSEKSREKIFFAAAAAFYLTKTNLRGTIPDGVRVDDSSTQTELLYRRKINFQY